MHKRVLSVTALAAVALGSVVVATPASAADADVRINEVQSNSATGAADFVELVNAGAEPVDVSGWRLVDGDPERTPDLLPAGTVLQPGAFLVVEPTFGLGANDAAVLSDDAGVQIDAYAWTEHAFTEGRLPDGTGAFVDTEPTPGAANVARAATVEPEPVETGIRVNEVLSNDPVLADFVELTNVGETAVDVSRWILRDSDPLSTLRIAEGTIVEPGAFVVIETNATADGFGLGSNDEISVITEDGTGLADSYAWTDHAASEGRVPDGTGAFVDTEVTRGQANVERRIASPVVINEVESNGDPVSDWVELANTDTTSTVDVSGWTIRDADPTNPSITLPEGTEIESGGYLGIRTDAPEDFFGLGGTDRVTVRDETGAVVDTFGWSGHAATTYGRCPDMTGAFAVTAASTFELVNDCALVEEPVSDTIPWPYGQDVQDAVAPGTWGEDMSGLDHAADGTLFAVNNDDGEIFEMAGGDGQPYVIARSWVPRYPDGTGQPDAEGISVAGDGAILLSTERDNTASNVSRPSVLRVELGEDGASTTTHEWNLTALTGPLGANAGIEAIEWISDADATGLGIVDASGATYDPAAYGPHLGGIVAFAVEATGELHLAVLEEDGGMTLLQTTRPGPAVSVVMGLDWRAGGNLLWALCDEACDNRLSTLAIVDGLLTWQADVGAPAAMPSAYTNEGLAIEYCDVADVTPTVLWISDTAHEGVSLRVAPGADCVAAEPTPEPSAPAPVPTDGPIVEDGDGDGGGVDVVDQAGQGGHGSLPRTGADAGAWLLALAMLLVVAGAAIAVRSSRRRA